MQILKTKSDLLLPSKYITTSQMAYFHSSWKANNPWYMYKCSSCGTPGTVDSLILEFSYEESRIQGILSILLNKQGIFSFKVLPVFCFLLGQSCPICLSFTEFSPVFLSIFLPAYLSYNILCPYPFLNNLKFIFQLANAL